MVGKASHLGSLDGKGFREKEKERDKTLGWDGWGHYLAWIKEIGWSLDSQAALTGLEIIGRGEGLGEAAKRRKGWGLQVLQDLYPSVLENLSDTHTESGRRVFPFPSPGKGCV